MRISSAKLGGINFDIERLSHTPKILNNNELYLVRLGKGEYVIFDMREFLPPFLSLSWIEQHKATELPTRLPAGYDRTTCHFQTQWNEHTFINALDSRGVFSSLVEIISRGRTKKYINGPSGPVASKFPFWMRRNGVNSRNPRKLVPFAYDGVVDLDKCLYPRDTSITIAIEAKATHITDLAWHKLSFPCHRFLEHDSQIFKKGRSSKAGSIVPVYCAYDHHSREGMIYVFPPIKVHRGARLGSFDGMEHTSGVILNDTRQMIPELTFKIDLSWV
jgi:hypothetical protein